LINQCSENSLPLSNISVSLLFDGITLNNCIVASNTLFQLLSGILLQRRYQVFLSTWVSKHSLLTDLFQTIVSHSQSYILSLLSTISGLSSIIFLSIIWYLFHLIDLL